MGLVMINSLSGNPQFGIFRDRSASLIVPAEFREIAAGNLQTNPMSRKETVRYTPEINLIFCDLSGTKKFRFLHGIAVTGPQNAVGNVEGSSIRIDINQFCSKVRIRSSAEA